MDSFGFAAPVLPGKEGVLRSLLDELRSRGDEVAESYKRAGVTLERGFLQQTPQGTFAVFYIEGKDTEKTFEKMVTSNLAIDKLLVEKIAEIHGFDPKEAAAAPPPEKVAEWIEPGTPRKTGLAFGAPLPSGKAEALKRFGVEAFTTRKAELRESRLAKGLNKERVFLLQTPMGDVAVVYLEGDDPAAANKEFAQSTSAYDTWFRKEAGAIFGIDFSQPLPPIEQVWDWEAK